MAGRRRIRTASQVRTIKSDAIREKKERMAKRLRDSMGKAQLTGSLAGITKIMTEFGVAGKQVAERMARRKLEFDEAQARRTAEDLSRLAYPQPAPPDAPIVLGVDLSSQPDQTFIVVGGPASGKTDFTSQVASGRRGMAGLLAACGFTQTEIASNRVHDGIAIDSVSTDFSELERRVVGHYTGLPIYIDNLLDDGQIIILRDNGDLDRLRIGSEISPMDLSRIYRGAPSEIRANGHTVGVIMGAARPLEQIMQTPIAAEALRPYAEGAMEIEEIIGENVRRQIREEVNAEHNASIINGKTVLNAAVVRDKRQRDLPHARFLADNQSFRTKRKRR